MFFKNMRDLYEILGLTKNNFTEKDLKQNYKKLALKYHPDRQVGKSDDEKKKAEEKFKEISHAYEVLSDPEKRKNYDMFGDENGNMQGNSGFNPFGGFDFNPFGGFDFGGFGERNRYSQQIRPGKTIQMNIPITINDLFNGLSKTIKYKKQVRCISCHGKGGTGETTCPTCHGTGKIVNKKSHGSWMQIEESVCPKCQGSGMFVEHKCKHCHGTGFEEKEVTLDINIPAGVPNNVGIQFEGKGSESKDHRGQNGDFIAITHYNIDDDKYIIEELNVIENIYIPYYDLLLGCSYTVNIPNGVTKTVKIKSCIEEAKLIRLVGEGLKDQFGNKGDYYVCVHYDIPKELSHKEQEHIEFIKNLHS